MAHQKDNGATVLSCSTPTPNDTSDPAESVRVTDVSVAPGGRAYLVERGLEQEGAGANAALKALVADYLDQATALDMVPMAVTVLDSAE